MAIQTSSFEVKRVIRLDGDGTVKAFCDVAVGSFVIKGVRVVEGRKGLFVSMPREQGKNGQWYDMVTPLTKEAKAELSEAVMEAFNSGMTS